MKEEFDVAPWWICNTFEDVEDVTYAWETLYKNILNSFVKTRKAKIRSNSLPWMTSAMRKLMNRRYKLLRIWQRTKNPETRKKYKELRNLVSKQMREAEGNYWKEQFQEATSAKDFWKIVKKVQRKNVTKKIGPIEDKEGNILTDDQMTANAFNEYFATIGEILSKEFSECVSENSNSVQEIPELSEIILDEDFLRKQIKEIKPEKAMGPDCIRPKDFHIAGESIVEGLKIIFNKIRESKQVPIQWKKGKLKVAPKNGNTLKRSNYRPLTMLCLPSKLMEGQIGKQLDDHVNINQLSTQHQWGYQKGVSTEMLLLNMTER